ncbi:DDIT3 protein, partial [Halcyon senegalensis]|nr:DDIT3 protein [Halcyon senegalensis]
MAAEGLAAGGPSWELEAWYQDLEEVLAAAEPGGASLPWGGEQRVPPWGTKGAGELDAALAAELLELESGAGTEPAGPPDPTSSLAGAGRGDDEEGAKRKKRRGGTPASRELAKRRDWANEQRVLELTAHNERLREEIRRLSAEVERTRAQLIDRIVNLRRV